VQHPLGSDGSSLLLELHIYLARLALNDCASNRGQIGGQIGSQPVNRGGGITLIERASNRWSAGGKAWGAKSSCRGPNMTRTPSLKADTSFACFLFCLQRGNTADQSNREH
jgi:hypothetical protein